MLTFYIFISHHSSLVLHILLYSCLHYHIMFIDYCFLYNYNKLYKVFCLFKFDLIFTFLDPYSTDYVLSMRDETSFTVDLQLSSGIQHNQFLRTELCLDGRVSYSTNMLTVCQSIYMHSTLLLKDKQYTIFHCAHEYIL